MTNTDGYNKLVVEIFHYFGDTLDLNESQMVEVSKYLEKLSKASHEYNSVISSGVGVLYELYSWVDE
jgi:hypothetical protein